VENLALTKLDFSKVRRKNKCYLVLKGPFCINIKGSFEKWIHKQNSHEGK